MFLVFNKVSWEYWGLDPSPHLICRSEVPCWKRQAEKTRRYHPHSVCKAEESLREGRRCPRPQAPEPCLGDFVQRERQTLKTENAEPLSEETVFIWNSVEKFKFNNVLKNNGGFGVKQFRGGWQIHEKDKLKCKSANLLERTRERNNLKELSQGKNKPQRLASKITTAWT